jgi:hypothetical protein
VAEAAGVEVAGVEAAGVEVPEMIRTWPTRILFAFVIEFKVIKFLVVVPNLAAIPLSVSPLATV